MRHWWTGLLAAIALAGAPAAASTFTLDTSAFINQGDIPKVDAARDGNCGGRNVSPPLRLSGAPRGTRSLAIVVFDPDAGGGRGFTHWIAYDIAPGTTSIGPGFGSAPANAFSGGRNDAATTLYWGPCPPPGDPPHRYVFTAYALDLPPGRLRRGLSREAFLKAVARHTLATAVITGRYAR